LLVHISVANANKLAFAVGVLDALMIYTLWTAGCFVNGLSRCLQICVNLSCEESGLLEENIVVLALVRFDAETAFVCPLTVAKVA
jgi:hypothetical protein